MTHLATISSDCQSVWALDAVYAFPDGFGQAQALAQRCGAAAGVIACHKFPDGESLITAEPAQVPGNGTVALFRSLYNPDAKLTELLLAASALRATGAHKVVLIAPYLPYMRQDRAFKPGQAISQAVIADLLATHFDGVVTIQPHLHRTHRLEDLFGHTPVITLKAGHAIAQDIARDMTSATVIVGPDEESEPLVRDVVEQLGLTWFTAKKVRKGDNAVTLTLPWDLNLAGHPVVIVDDIISSGATVAALAQALTGAGAGPITAYAVHALFDAHVEQMLRRAGVSKVKSLSTVPHTSNAVPVIDIIAAGIGVRS